VPTEAWNQLPVSPVRQTVRLTMPQTTAPLVAPSRPTQTQGTSRLILKPPSLGKYTYWDCRASGFRLEYKKRDASQLKKPVGWRYLYFGYWSRADMLAILTELSPEDALRVLHAEANRSAKLFLKRKQEREKDNELT